MNPELGTTTTIITHNALIAEIAGHVVALADGRIVSERANDTKAPTAKLR